MFVAGPVAQRAGIRNLYFGSAAMLALIGVVGYGMLRRPRPAAKAESAAAD